MKKILELKNVKKIYGTGENTYLALEDVSISINVGEFVGVMGPSGAGKSTLLNIVSGIDRVTSGSVLIVDEEISDMDDDKKAEFRQKNLGFVFQDFNLLDTLTIKDNIALPLAIAKESSKIIDQKVALISKTLGIDDLLSKFPYQISGGQKQRTAIARSIVTNPSLVLADEPTGALDSKSAKNILNSFCKLNCEFNATILMVTHDTLTAAYCNRVIFIKDGNIFTEINKNQKSNKDFFEEILQVQSQLESLALKKEENSYE